MKNVKRFNKGLSALVTVTLIIGAMPQVALADTNTADTTNTAVENFNNTDYKYINVSTLPKIENTELGKFWGDFDKYRVTFPKTTKDEFDVFSKYVQSINDTNKVTVNGVKYENTGLVNEENIYNFGLLGLDLNPSAFTKDINTVIVEANGYNTMKIKIKKDGSFISQEEIKSSSNTTNNNSTNVEKHILPTLEKVEYGKFYSDLMKCRLSFLSQRDEDWNTMDLYRKALNSKGEIIVNGTSYLHNPDLDKENSFNFALTGLELTQDSFKDGLNTLIIKVPNYKDMTVNINKVGDTMSISSNISDNNDTPNPESPTTPNDKENTSNKAQEWGAVTSLPKITNTRYGEIYGRVEYEITFDQNDTLQKYLRAADPENPDTKLAELTVNGVRYYDNFNFSINEYHLSYIGGLELNDKAFTEDVNTIILKVDGFNDMRIKVKKDGTLISQEEYSIGTVSKTNLQINIRTDLHGSAGEPINLMKDILASAIDKEKMDLTDQIKVLNTGGLDINNPKAGTYEVTYSVTYNGETKEAKRKVIISNATISADNLEDGIYTIGFKALRYDVPKNESMLGGFFDEKVKVTVDNGKITLTMLNTLHASTLMDICIESNGEYAHAKREFTGEANSRGDYNMQICEVEVSDLTSEHTAAVLVGMMGGSKSDLGNYSKYTKARLVFDKNCSKGWDGFNQDKEVVNNAEIFNNALVEANLDFDKDGTVTDEELSMAKGSISLSGKQLKDISRLKNLGSGVTELYLSGNNIKSLPEGIFDNLTGLEKLYLSSNALVELPQGIFDKLTNLKELTLSQNYISKLPEGIFDNLTKLTSLGFTENYLSDLPNDIFNKLTSLEGLYLYNNKIANIPTGIGKLKSLKTLSLNQNKIEVIPNEIGNLSNLTKLSLNNNLIKEVPEEIYNNLKNLSNFDIYDNELSSVPDNIKELLPNVSYFDFKLNKLTKKPSVAKDNFYPQKDALNLKLTAKDGTLTWTQDLSALDMYIWSIYMDTSSSLDEYTKKLEGKTPKEYLREKSKDWRITTEVQKKDATGNYITVDTTTTENEDDAIKGSYFDKDMKDGDEYRVIKSLLATGSFENLVFSHVSTIKNTLDTTGNVNPDTKPDSNINITPDIKPDTNINSNSDSNVKPTTTVDSDITSNPEKDNNSNTNNDAINKQDSKDSTISAKKNNANTTIANSSDTETTTTTKKESKPASSIKEEKLPKTGALIGGGALATLGATLSALGFVLNKKSKKK